MGNRTSKTDSGGTGSGATYTFDAANRLTSVTPTGGATASVTFDADGNTLTDASGRTYTWDSENRMTSCTYQGDTTTYTYGYDGLRRSSTKDSVTTNYVYDGTNLVAEMRPNASGTLVVVTDYLLGAQGIEAKIDETNQTEAYYELNPTTGARLFDANNNLIVAYRGVTSWYIYDGHGNVVGTVNGVTGAYTANPTLDVYGVPRASGTAATKQGYCGSLGHVTDDTGLVYMRARYYDPGCGRFINQDPSQNGPNWCVYAGDNPVTLSDSTGKNPVLIFLAIIAVSMALGGLWGGIAGATFSYAKTGSIDWKSVWESALTGAAIGLVAGLGIGAATLLGASGIAAMFGASASIANAMAPLENFFVTAILGGAASAAGGAIAGLIAREVEDATAIASLDCD
jgi:RHS repeat-associated protein